MYAHSRPVHHAWHVMVRFCNRSCRCMSSLRGGPPVLNQLQWARHYAKMANLPPAISQAPEGPQGRLIPRYAKLHCLERPRRMVALWGRKLEDPSRLFLQRYGTRSLYGASSRGIPVKKSGIFGQPELFDPKSTRHFLQYARRAHARISSSWHEPACMNRHA